MTDDFPHAAEPSAASNPTASAKVAVVTEPYGAIRHLAPEEAENLIEAKQARLATPIDLAIGG